MAMFGLLLSGRLVDTSFRQVDESHVVIDIENIETANHVVVFLTGQQSFPAGMGGAVYFAWPPGLAHNISGDGEVSLTPCWQFLGTLSNTKPSAIFKIARAKKADLKAHSEAMVARFGQLGHSGSSRSNVAQLGISMEPLTQLDGMSPDGQTEASTLPTFVEYSRKMLENLSNFASSYAISAIEVQRRPQETFIPWNAFQTWYNNFERRLQQNPNFWRS